MARDAGDLTAGAAPFAEAELEGCVCARFEAQADLSGARVAIRGRDRSITYDALDRWANRIAWGALDRLGEEAEPVALLLADRTAALAGTLALLKAGKVRVHLEPALPVERLAWLLRDSGARLLVAEAATLPLAGRLAGELGIRTVEADAASSREERPRLSIPPDTPADLLYTSGSTGAPKGVVISHRNVLWGCYHTSRHDGLGPGDRLLFASSPGAGQARASFHGLLCGATLFPFHLEEEGLGALGSRLRDEEITSFHSVPSVFRALCRSLEPGARFPRLRLLKVGGDTVRRDDVELFQRTFGEPCRLRVGYGSSEAGSIACHLIAPGAPLDGAVVPVGRPHAGTEVRLVDEDGRDVPPGEPGEMVVRSQQVALGYWRRPELTRERFGEEPARGPGRTFRTGDVGRLRPDGLLEHLGRTDGQVKVRGVRVETAEVELALRRLPGVADAVVAARPDATGEKRLVGYVVLEGQAPAAPALREALGRTLPTALVPEAIVPVERIPLNARGKVDLNALPEPGPAADPAGAEDPRDELEAFLAAAFRRLLRVPAVGPRSDFFELGGNSLLAAELFALVERHLGRHLPLSAFLGASTPEALARLLREGPPSRWPTLVPVKPSGTRPPFFCIHTGTGEVLSYLPLAVRLHGEQPVYGLRCDRLEDKRPRQTRIEEMAATYLAEIRKVQPEGPYRIGGHSGGAVIALEMAHQLRAAGEEPAALVLFDPPALEGRHLREQAGRGRSLAALLHDLPSWAAFYATKLRLLEPAERRSYLRDKLGKLARKLRRLEDPFSKDFRKAVEAGPEIAASLAPNLRPFLEPYAPRLYPGDATLFLARWQPLRSRRLSTWRALVGGTLDLHVVPGFHEHILLEPFVRVVAPIVARALAASEERPPAPLWGRSRPLAGRS